jgi:hypothetical protein
MEYDVVIIGGIPNDTGRPIGPYRLRTSLENAGYSALVVDCALVLRQQDLLKLLSYAITPRTRMIGISTIWFKKNTVGVAVLDEQNSDDWYNPEFFNLVREKWPWVKLVAGGSTLGPLNKIKFDYSITGYADNSIVVLLEDIINNTRKTKFSISTAVKTIDSDTFYPVQNTDEIETIWKPTDGWLPYQPIPLEVSRGCIFKCSFCNHPFLGKKSYEYIRSKESLASEMQRNYEMFGTTRYLLIDDTFNDSVEKLDRLLRAIEISKIPDFEFVGYIRPEMLVTKPEMIPMLAQLNIRGGFVGLESFGSKARMAVGKGMDIERVLEALAKTKDQTKVKWQSGFIVGLPGDTPDMLWNSVDRLKSDKIISCWNPTALQIGGTSLFMKQPEKYGYIFVNGDADNWINDVGMTASDAAKLAADIDRDSADHLYVSGWHIGPNWFHNASHKQLESKLGQLRYKGLGRRTALARATDLMNLLKQNSTNTKNP